MLRLTVLPSHTGLWGPAPAEATERNLQSREHQIKSVRNAATHGLRGRELGQRPVRVRVSEPRHLQALHTGHWAVMLAEGRAGRPGVSSALKHFRGLCSFIYSTPTWGECQVLFQVLRVQQRTRQSRLLPPRSSDSSWRVRHQTDT